MIYDSELEQALDEQKRTGNKLVDFSEIYNARDVAEELLSAEITEFTVSEADCLADLFQFQQCGAVIEEMTTIISSWNTQVPAVKLSLKGANNAEEEASAD